MKSFYDGIGRALAHAMDEFDDKLAKRDAKIADLQARIAERQSHHQAKLIELQTKHIKQLKSLNARLADIERKMAALKDKAQPPSIIAWKTDKVHFRLTPYMSDDRPGPAAPLYGLFETYHEQVNG